MLSNETLRFITLAKAQIRCKHISMRYLEQETYLSRKALTAILNGVREPTKNEKKRINAVLQYRK